MDTQHAPWFLFVGLFPDDEAVQELFQGVLEGEPLEFVGLEVDFFGGEIEGFGGLFGALLGEEIEESEGVQQLPDEKGELHGEQLYLPALFVLEEREHTLVLGCLVEVPPLGTLLLNLIDI